MPAPKGKTSENLPDSQNDPLLAAIGRIRDGIDRTPEDAQRAIIDRVLHAETVDDILAESVTNSAEQVVGIPHTIIGVEYNRSRFEDGGPAYAYVTAESDDGEMSYTIGATTALAQLIKLDAHLPVKVVLKQKETATASGYYPMYYVKG